VEKVFQGIQANGFAASSASLGVLVELISKYALYSCRHSFEIQLLCSPRHRHRLTLPSGVSPRQATKTATNSVLALYPSSCQSLSGSSMLS
jgi:hypothetical protein